MPYAAIYIPDFPVEAILRAEPELREQAVAVVEGAPPLVHVIAVNERASQLGIEPAMTKLQAEERLRASSKHASTIRQRSEEREAAAHAALLDCACGFSPRVEDTAADTVVLDLAGLERIFGPPAKLARDMARRCSELGLEANVAVASNADTAVLAARGFAGVTIIAEGKEAERLGELGVDILVATDWGRSESGQSPVASRRENRQSTIDYRKWVTERPVALGGERAPTSVEILETLERWGVRNLRALAALPEIAMAERLGQEGLGLQKLARGEVRRPLLVAEPPLVFEEAVELDYPVEMLEPLAFLLHRMLEQLCARLAARALATNEIKFRLDLQIGRDFRIEELTDCRIEKDSAGPSNSTILQSDNSSIHERTLRLPVAMLDAKVFLKLLQLDLQAHPPSAPVTKVWLRAEPAEPRRAQNGLFVPQAPEEEKLSVTLARINKVVGQAASHEKNCRLPMADGRWRQEAEEQRPSAIDHRHGEERVGSPEILDTHRPDGFRMKPFAVSGQESVVSGQHAGEGARATPASSITALRVFRPALSATVTLRDGRPSHLASPDRPAMRGEVVWCAGPWRSSGEWWTEQVWSRAEWDVAVRNEEGVALYRIYRDDVGGKWWVEGTYD